MRGAPEKVVGLSLVFLAGVLAGVYGIVTFLLSPDAGLATGETLGGFTLLAWVIFHPARAPERV